jgi:uncharacterized phage infection (PIP) family protein YhgE
MKQVTMTKAIILSIVIAGFLLIIAVRPVSAEESTVRTKETTEKTETEIEKTLEKSPTVTTEKRKESGEARKYVAKERLKDASLSACKDREEKINTIMNRVAERSQKHVDRMSEVSEKAKAFYEKAGNILSNYDELVADVDAKKVLARTAVDTLVSQANFTCESEGPKSDLQAFRDKRLTKIQAVSDYRDAVKALLAGIKSVQPIDTTATEKERQ